MSPRLNKSALFIYHSILRNFKVNKISRHFHASSNVYIRKHVVKSSVDELSHDTIKKIQSSHDESSSFDDYFGIESDEGAILIDDSATVKLHKEAPFNESSVSTPVEKFYVTSFGYLRKDSENKPIFHGQYEMSEDTENQENSISLPFLDKFTENMNLSLFNKNNNEKLSTVEFSNTILKECSNEAILEKNTVEVSATTNSVKHHQIKKSTLTKKVETAPIIIDENNILNDIGSSKTSQTHSFIDDMFFSDKCYDTEIETNIAKLSATNDETNDVSISKNPQSNSNSYIDEMYFPDGYSNTDKVISSHLKNTDIINKIDVSNSDVNNTNSYIDDVYFPSNLDNTEAEMFNDDKKNINDENLKSSLSNIQTNISNSTISTSKNNLYDSYHKIQSTELKNSATLVKSNKKFAYKQADNKFMNSTVNIPEDITQEPIIRNTKIIVSNETNLITSQRKLDEHITKHGEPVYTATNVTSESNNFETAKDFVQNVRQNSSNYSQLKDKTIAQRESLDSKGFKILENQVLKLSYFTRDEILEMLTKSVIYSDERIVVLNKPYNLIMHDSKTTQDPCLSTFLDDLAKELDRGNPSPELHIIHRLDKETTGCLLLARNEITAQYLKSLFSQRKISKTYWIVTTKVPNPLEGIIDIPIAEGLIEKRSRMVLSPQIPKDMAYSSHAKRGKRAISHYKVIATSGSAALVEVRPETGIKHQIRVHFGFGLLCPILGDHKYSHLQKLAPQKLPGDMLQKLRVRQSKVRHIPIHIHARHIVIPEYENGRNLFVSAPIPQHMSRNLQTLKFRKE